MTTDRVEAAAPVLQDDATLSSLDEVLREDAPPPRRRRRVRRALLGAVACLVVLLLTVVAVSTIVTVRLSSNLDRLPGVFDGLTNRPQRPASGPGADAVNILVLGTDRRSEVPTTGSGAKAPAWVPGAQRTDAMMILHIDGDRRGASLISIPRDSWVLVPGYGAAKINAAFSYGGPSLAVQTVETLTGVRMDHLALTDWDGFSSMIDSLGGVDVRVPKTVTDSARDVVWTQGRHTLDGEEALTYVGERHGLPLGDLDRVRRQQAVFRALATETLRQSPLSDPLDVYRLLSTTTQHLSVDDGWSLSSMASLLRSLSHLRGSDITYATAPVAGFGREGSQSIVRLDEAANRGLWGAVIADEVDTWAEHHRSEITPRVVR